jgi:hypothetical protein
VTRNARALRFGVAASSRRPVPSLAIATAIGLAGCAQYAAPLGHVAERGDVRIRLDSISGGRTGTRVVFTLEETPGNVTLLEARLAAESTACQQGASADRIGRSRASTQEAPLQPGEQVTLAFSPQALALVAGRDAHIALLLGTPRGESRCIEMPLGEGDAPVELRAEKRVTLGLEAGLSGFGKPLGPVAQYFSLPVTAGVWLGDTHIGVGAGPLGAGCPDTHCPPPGEERRIDHTTGFLGLVGIGRSLVHGGAFGFDAVLRYRLTTLPANTYTGRQLVVAHGVTVEPILAVVGTPLHGLPRTGGSREGLFGIGIPFGYTFADSGDGAFTFGFEFRLMLSVL